MFALYVAGRLILVRSIGHENAAGGDIVSRYAMGVLRKEVDNGN